VGNTVDREKVKCREQQRAEGREQQRAFCSREQEARRKVLHELKPGFRANERLAFKIGAIKKTHNSQLTPHKKNCAARQHPCHTAQSVSIQVAFASRLTPDA
jgi:hypothetical protein